MQASVQARDRARTREREAGGAPRRAATRTLHVAHELLVVLLRLGERRGLLRDEGLDLAGRGLQLPLQLARDLVGLLHLVSVAGVVARPAARYVSLGAPQRD